MLPQPNGKLFSPRARGCSELRQLRQQRGYVFPACAGMFRIPVWVISVNSGFPRVRGDVPRFIGKREAQKVFSPRARGCSPLFSIYDLDWDVFPACAGMFRPWGCVCAHSVCFPRVRGDVPRASRTVCVPAWFSPRARGCSPIITPPAGGRKVFPACTGMFLISNFSASKHLSFPRVRGDVPSFRKC